MKAIVWIKYGSPDVLQLKEVEKPVPKDNEVLIKIHATTVTAGDCEMRGMKVGMMFRVFMRLYIGIRKPKRITILGMELSGEVEAVGKDVNSFNIGDEIIATMGFSDIGTYTEYKCLPSGSKDTLIAIKPVNMSHEEAAAVPMGGLEALQYLRKGKLQKGYKILINGAGGTIGTYAVQLAKFFGAEVTGVDSSDKLDMLRSIGADHVIDYTQQDFIENNEKYDVILDVVGKRPFSDFKKPLKKKGMLLLANPKLRQIIRGRFSSVKVKAGALDPSIDDLMFLKELIEEGKLKSIIDKTFPLEQVVEAHRYVETGQKKGHVVIKVME